LKKRYGGWQPEPGCCERHYIRVNDEALNDKALWCSNDSLRMGLITSTSDGTQRILEITKRSLRLWALRQQQRQAKIRCTSWPEEKWV